MESIVEKLRKLRQPGPEGEYHAVTEAIFADKKQPSGGMSMIMGVHKTLEAAQENAATLCKNFPHDFLIFRGRPTHLFIDFYDPSASVILAEDEIFNKEILEAEKRRNEAEKRAREKDEALGLHNAALQEQGSNAHISQTIYLLMQHESKIADLQQKLQHLLSRNQERKQELRAALLKNPEGGVAWKAYLRPVISKYDGALVFGAIESWWEANCREFLPLPPEEPLLSPPPPEEPLPSPSPPEEPLPSPSPPEEPLPSPSPPEGVGDQPPPWQDVFCLPSSERNAPSCSAEEKFPSPEQEKPVNIESPSEAAPQGSGDNRPEEKESNPVLSIPSVPPLSLPSPPQKRRLRRQQTIVGSAKRDPAREDAE